MKKITLLLFSLLFVNLILAQANAIKITNQASAKEIIIKESKRIRVQTTDGQKISGRFSIVDGTTLLIKDQRIDLADIESIKRHPLLTSLFTSTFFIYGGALAVGFGALIGILVDSSAYYLIIPGAAMIYTGIKSPNFNRNFKKDKNWTFELITLNGLP